MLDKLRAAKEIAVDLEYHNYRSFGGFVCLMQISSREEDFVVDTLALRDELEELNEVFTNPNIVKVYACSLRLVSEMLTYHRSSMERRVILCGCSKTSTSTWSTYSIPTMPLEC